MSADWATVLFPIEKKTHLFLENTLNTKMRCSVLLYGYFEKAEFRTKKTSDITYIQLPGQHLVSMFLQYRHGEHFIRIYISYSCIVWILIRKVTCWESSSESLPNVFVCYVYTAAPKDTAAVAPFIQGALLQWHHCTILARRAEKKRLCSAPMSVPRYFLMLWCIVWVHH